MATFTLVKGYTWASGEVVTATKLNSAALPTLASGQTYSFNSGSAAAPGVDFAGGGSTGLYLSSPTTGIGFSVSGVSVGFWQDGQLNVTGSVSAGISFVSAGGVSSDFISVNSVSPTSPNRTVGIKLNGATYYLAAKTTND